MQTVTQSTFHKSIPKPVLSLLLMLGKAATGPVADFPRHCTTFLWKAGQAHLRPTTPTLSQIHSPGPRWEIWFQLLIFQESLCSTKDSAHIIGYLIVAEGATVAQNTNRSRKRVTLLWFIFFLWHTCALLFSSWITVTLSSSVLIFLVDLL